MIDINLIIANNVMNQMKQHNTKQIELAKTIGVTKQVMSKMLNGSRLISIVELRRIANYFHVHVSDLMKLSMVSENDNVIQNLMCRVNSEAARQALRTADELADMIIFHGNVRENAQSMMLPWDM